MKRYTKPVLFLLLSSFFVVTSCKKDEPNPVDDSENLTTLKLTFTDKDGKASIFTYKDADGVGGNAPTIDKITLKANATYTLAVEVLDESKNPAEDITTEIEEESDEHLFVYTPTPTSLMTVTRTDKDSRNYEIGLTASAVVGAAGTGKLQVVLYHQPPQNGTPIKDGTAKGSTDFSAEFEVTVN